MKKHNSKHCNKKWFVITTLAGAATLAMPVQALELNVYGVGHLSADNVNDGADSAIHVTSNSSRLGFRGNQDIGDGMKVLFQLESGADLTGQGSNDGNGGGTTSGVFTDARDSYVGLGGGFGTVLAGKLGGLNQWLYDYNLFGDQVGDLGNIWGGSGLPGRVTSALHYRTPDFNGISVGLSYVPDENTAVTQDATVVKVDYVGGALKIGGALATIKTAAEDWSVNALTASYDFGKFTVGGGLQTESNMAGVSGADRSSYTLGASMKVGGNSTLKAQIANSSADGVDNDASQLAIGYDHSLNKYATVYVAYAATTNEANATFTANNWGHGDAVTPVAGDDPNVLSVGLVVNFDVGLSR